MKAMKINHRTEHLSGLATQKSTKPALEMETRKKEEKLVCAILLMIYAAKPSLPVGTR